MDTNRYLDIFIEESKEHLQDLNDQILILEEEPDNVDTINEIFRAAHSLKGMAGTMGYKKMLNLTHTMEDTFSEIRNGNMVVTTDLIDIIFEAVDVLETYLDNIIDFSDEGEVDSQGIIDQFNKLMKDKGSYQEPSPKPEKAEDDESRSYLVKEDGRQVKKLIYDDFEYNAIVEAENKGLNVYSITVYLSEHTVLKAARSFLIFRNLRQHGEIIKSDPSSNDIEDENFDFDFTIVLITEENMDFIRQTIEKVSEIDSVAIEEVKSENIGKDQLSSMEKRANEKALRKAADSKTLATTEKTKGKSTSPASRKGVTSRSVRVDIEKLDELMNLVSELTIAKNSLVELEDKNNQDLEITLRDNLEYLERITTNLHDSVMKVRMVPLENIFNRFPRMIRDLSKNLGKKMELNISGEETELDRTVIDEIGDPLMHLLRNAADHGLETNEERERLGKPPVGTINLSAYQEGNDVVIEVSDDGAGINIEEVRQKAIIKGMYTTEQAATLTDEEVIEFLFEPSFSTSKNVTEVSGRGVGLDVVRTNINSLSGSVEAKSKPGQGTTFIVRLPLTLAIIQALMIKVASERYAIPLSNVQSVEEVYVSDIDYIQNTEVINLRDEIIPIVYLDKIIDSVEDVEYSEELTVMIIRKGDKKIGVVISEYLGQQEIVVKSIGKYINNDKIIGGATILGNGEVALILELNSLI